MRPHKQTQYEQFLAKLTAHFTLKNLHQSANVVTMAQALVTLAGQYNRIQETECNRELTSAEHVKELRIAEQLRELSSLCSLPLKLGGDPRGYTVKCFLADESYNTWGGKEEGYGIPTNFKDYPLGAFPLHVEGNDSND